jgi:hypothetical protein
VRRRIDAAALKPKQKQKNCQLILCWQIKPGVFQMTNRFVPITAIATLFLIGCGETPKETANDVTAAGKEADKSTTEAREELGTVQTSALSRRAKAKYDLAITTAEENYRAATQKCNEIGGADLVACESAAEAILTSANADAATLRDAALLAAK